MCRVRAYEIACEDLHEAGGRLDGPMAVMILAMTRRRALEMAVYVSNTLTDGRNTVRRDNTGILRRET